MATKVKLRSKKITQGKLSLYLDYYPPIPHPETGKSTRREFLNIHILEKAKTYQDKENNRVSNSLAEDIRAKRQLQIREKNFGFLNKQSNEMNRDFIAFFNQICTHKQNTTSKSNWSNWKSTGKHLKEVFGETRNMNEVTPELCKHFRVYLLSHLSQNSASSYFLKFREAINEAMDAGLMDHNPLHKIKVIPPAESKREFLSLDELRQMASAECLLDWLKRAALFTALTGLRFVDIQKLKWSEIEHSKELGYYIRVTQRKTKGTETLPISDQAYGYLGERKDPEDKIFEGIPEKMGSWENLRLKEWALKAGITKNITFHVFRHTFATLQLTLGTDIFTVSKMLGHKNLKTTQIYARVIDEKKKEAADKIVI